jgi:hypothetical protein
MPTAAEFPCRAQLCATCSLVKWPTIEGLLILASCACSFALIVAGVLLRVLNTQGMPTGKNAPPINGWQRFEVTSHQMQPASYECRKPPLLPVEHCSLLFALSGTSMSARSAIILPRRRSRGHRVSLHMHSSTFLSGKALLQLQCARMEQC